MHWLIPTILIAAAFVFWLLSHRTDDRLVAWCRFMLACFLALIGAAYVSALAARWLFT